MLLFQSLFFLPPQNLPIALQTRNFLILRKGISSCRNTAIASATPKDLSRALRTPPPAQLLSCHPQASLERMCRDHVLCRQQAVSGYSRASSFPGGSLVLTPPFPSPPPLCTLLPRPAAPASPTPSSSPEQPSPTPGQLRTLFPPVLSEHPTASFPHRFSPAVRLRLQRRR